MNRSLEIRSEAIRLYNQMGWQRVSVRDISDALGISPGNLSYHYPRKQHLKHAVLLHLWSSEREIIRAIHESEPDLGKFLAVLRQVFRFQLDNHGCYSMMYLHYDELKAEDGRTLEQVKESMFREILSRLTERQQINAAGEDQAFLAAFLLMICRSWIMDHSLDGERDINRYMYLISQQFYYFATGPGMNALDRFLEDI